MMRLLDLFGRFGARSVLKVRARWPARWVTVLLYHRVLPTSHGFVLDPEVVDCTPEEFDDHMRLVASTCSPIDLDLLLRFIRGETPLPHNPVLVTFDDGYRDNREHALPVLRRYGIRGTFFVSSGYVAERRLFWWDRIRYLIDHARVATGRLTYPTDVVLRLSEDRAHARRTALRIVKTCHGLDLERFLAGLGRALEVAWADELERHLVDEHVMTWDDVRALHAAGMDVGSHTRTHRPLDTLDARGLREELVESRAEIEGAIHARVSSISYPLGRPVRRLPLVERAVRGAGYDVGFSVEERANPVARFALDPLNVTRLTVDAGTPTDRLAALLAAPESAGAA